jgi:hypothetical protein
MSNRPASCWVTHGAERWSVSIPQRDVPDSTVPQILRNELILSCSTSPAKFLRQSSWLPLSGWPALPGFRPSSRHLQRRPHARENTLSRFVPPTGFLSLSTGYSATGFAGLFHPAATSRVSLPFRGFSRLTASLAHRQLVPPWCCPSSAHPRPRSQAAASELLTFEALIRKS